MRSGVGFRVQGFGFRAWSSGIRVSGFGFGFQRFRIQVPSGAGEGAGLGKRFRGFGFRFPVFGLRDSDSGLRDSDPGPRDSSFRISKLPDPSTSHLHPRKFILLSESRYEHCYKIRS